MVTFQRWERDLGIPRRSWLTDGKSAVCLGKSDLTDDHLVRTDERVVYAPSVRRLAEQSWLEETLRAVVETPQKPKTTVDIPPAAEPLVPHAPPEVPEDEKEEPTAEPEEDEEMQGKPVDKRDTRSVEHRNTRECVCEETSGDEITEAAGHTCFHFLMILRSEDCC